MCDIISHLIVYKQRWHLYARHSGFLNGVSFTLIDKTDPRCRTKKQDGWIHTLKTKTLRELNFDFKSSHLSYYLVFLHFSNWIWTASF